MHCVHLRFTRHFAATPRQALSASGSPRPSIMQRSPSPGRPTSPFSANLSGGSGDATTGDDQVAARILRKILLRRSAGNIFRREMVPWQALRCTNERPRKAARDLRRRPKKRVQHLGWVAGSGLWALPGTSHTHTATHTREAHACTMPRNLTILCRWQDWTIRRNDAHIAPRRSRGGRIQVTGGGVFFTAF